MDIKYAMFLAKKQKTTLTEELKTPFSIDWGNNFEDIKGNKNAILKDIGNQHTEITELNILSYILHKKNNLNNCNLTSIQDIITCENIKNLILSNIDENALSNIKEVTSFPVIFVKNNNGEIIYFVYIVFNDNFNFDFINECIWLKEVTDANFKTSIKDSIKATASKNNIYFFPITDLNLVRQFKGKSAGLPLAVSILNPGYFPKNKNVIATGHVTQNRKIKKVGHLDNKANKSIEAGIKFFLCPDESNLTTLRIKYKDKIDFLTFAGLDDIKILLDSNPAQYNFYQSSINDIRFFFNNISDMDENIITKIITDKPDEIKNFILSDSNNIKLLSDKLELLLKDKKNYIKAYKLLDLIDDINYLQKNLEKDIIHGFNLCSVCLACYNHQGNFNKSDEIWQLVNFSNNNSVYIDEMEKAGKFPEVNNLLNRIFVSLHNKYNFNPDLEELHKLKSLAEKLESATPMNAANEDLAKIYGTISQHYAFCKDIKNFNQYFEKACKFFGNGTINNNDLKKGYLRQFSYCFFSLLDDNKLDEAEKALLKYLGSDKTNFSEIDETSCATLLKNLFNLFIIIRFLLEKYSLWQNNEIVCYDKIVEMLTKQEWKNDHPYQLILYNLGKIEFLKNNFENSKNALTESFNICCSLGPTLIPMKLLPLSFMFKHNYKLQNNGINFSQETNKIMETIKTQGFSQGHFEGIENKKIPGEVLEEVYKNTAQYFPFSYR